MQFIRDMHIIPHGTPHLLSRMSGQQPDQPTQFPIQQGREVEEGRPDEQQQDHSDKGIGDGFFARCQRVDPVGDLVAVVFQSDAID